MAGFMERVLAPFLRLFFLFMVPPIRSPVAKKTAKKTVPDPCGSCGTNSEDGIDCDECNRWFCSGCVNIVEGVLSAKLYRHLTKLSHPFGWRCHECYPAKLLPGQLIDAGYMTEADAVKLECSADAIMRGRQPTGQPRKPDTAKPEAIPTATDPQLEQSSSSKEETKQILAALARSMNQQERDRRDQHDERQMLLQTVQAFQQLTTQSRATAAHTAGGASMSKLPTIELQTFNGDVLLWHVFWESFKINVHDRTDLHDRFKLEYLFQVLKGKARDKIEGLGREASKYPEAIAILESTYANETAIFKANMETVKRLPSVSPSLINLESFTDQLRTRATAINHHTGDSKFMDSMVETILFDKLPSSLKMEIDRMRLLSDKQDEAWTLNSFLKTLTKFQKLNTAMTDAKATKPVTTGTKRFSATAETGLGESIKPPPTCMFYSEQRQVGPKPKLRPQNQSRTQGNPSHQGHQGNPSHHGHHGNNQHFNERGNNHFAPRNNNFNRQGGGRIAKPTRPCVYCGQLGVHFSDHCDRVADLGSRREIIKRERRCSICLGSLDQGHICYRLNKPCFYCRQTGLHHSSLCAQRPTLRTTNNSRQTSTSQLLACQTTQAEDNHHYSPTDAPESTPTPVSAPAPCPAEPEPQLRPSAEPTAATAPEVPVEAPPAPEQASSTPPAYRPLNQAPTAGQEAVSTIAALAATAPSPTGIVLATFPATARNRRTGQPVKLNVLLDTGARHSCCQMHCLELLDLLPEKEVTLTTARFGADKPENIRAKVVHFTLTGATGFQTTLRAYAMEKMAPPLHLQPVQLPASTWQRLKELEAVNIPPRRVDATVAIHVIIGMDRYFDVMPPGMPTTPLLGTLAIHHSPMGNIICGRADHLHNTFHHGHNHDDYHYSSVQHLNHNCDANSLHEEGSSNNFDSHEDDGGHRNFQTDECSDLERLWKLESLGISSNEDDDRCNEQHRQQLRDFFKATTTFHNGRYYVKFPFKDAHPKLPSNYLVARRRLHQTLKMLKKRGKLADYNRILQEQRQLGITEPATQLDGPLEHYVCHFPVFRSDPLATTKVRIVMDPSTKTWPDGKTLNDLIDVGDNYLEDMVAILVRFLTYKVALVADLAKAFHNVGLHKDHRDAVRFLWIDHNDQDGDINDVDVENLDNLTITKERMCRVPFGVGASPNLLLSVIRLHLSNHNSNLASNIMDSIYVDNVVVGFDDTQACVDAYHESKQIFAEASMQLREFLTNDGEAMKVFDPADTTETTTAKVLGLRWDSVKDTIAINVHCQPAEKCNKRWLLKCIAKTFDVLGWICLITVRGRILIQKLWKEGFDWDTPASEEIEIEWREIEQDIFAAATEQFDRRIFLGLASEKTFILIGFSDASEKAYSYVLYLLATLKGDSLPRSCNLVMAKAKVAPVKALTVPRLELLAMLICARALRWLKRHIGLEIHQAIQFTDSQICLAWLQSSKPLKTFVSNRVEEIKGNGDIQFRWTDTKRNPADLPSRGASLAEMRSPLWRHGPAFLMEDQAAWPHCNPNPAACDLAATEEKPDKKELFLTAPAFVASQTEAEEPQTPFGIDATRFSDLGRLHRVTGYCLRFIKAARKMAQPNHKALTAAENKETRQLWIRTLQKDRYSQEIELLKAGKANQLIKQLDLFLQDDIVRLGGRFKNAELSRDERNPALLPPKHPYTDLVILFIHAHACAHLKLQSTLTEVRRRYWIPHGNAEVRRVLKRCQICLIVEGKTLAPPKMGHLPPERLLRAPAFAHCGLDFAGPFYTKEKGANVINKRYIAVFSCMVTRANHFELQDDLSAEKTAGSIVKMASRRGYPKTLLTDNAPTFDKAADILKAIWGMDATDAEAEGLVSFFAEHELNWRRIRPRCPWEGGMYERKIGVLKRCLKKVLWRCTIDDEGLRTLVTMIEGVMNGTPLLSLQTTPDDGGVLCPADFIAPTARLALPPNDEDEDDPDWTPDPHAKDKLIGFFKKGLMLLDKYWKLYNTQYLQELREASSTYFKEKRGSVHQQPQVGKTYLIQQPGHTPRATWPIATVIKLLKSPNDGEVRFVQLRTANGHITKRGVKDLCPLELEIADLGPQKVKDGEEQADQLSVFLAQALPAPPLTPTATAPHSGIHSGVRTGHSASSLSGRAFLMLALVSCFLGTNAATASPAHQSWMKPPPGPESVFQLCLKGPGGKAFALPKEQPPCIWPERHHRRDSHSVGLWVPNHELPLAAAYLCFRQIATVCTYTSVFLAHGLTRPVSKVEKNVPLQLCKQLKRSVHSHRSLQYESHRETQLFEVEPGLWSTNRTIILPYQWCCKEICKSTENLILHLGQVATGDGNSLTSNLAHLAGCEVSKGFCISSGWTAVWLNKDLLNFCAYRFKGDYNGTGDEHYLTIDSIQSSFTFTDRSRLESSFSQCLPRGALFTRERAAIVFNKHGSTAGDPHPRASIPDLIRLLASPLADETNVKLEQLGRLVEAELQERYGILHFHYCQVARQTIQLGIQLAKLDSSLGFRFFLARGDVVACPLGDVYIVSTCRQLQAQLIYSDHRLPGSDVCYEFTPIKVKGFTQLLFAADGSRDLVAHSRKVPCSTVHSAVFEISPSSHGIRRFSNGQGSIHVSELSPLLSWNESESANHPSLIFDSPKLFTSQVALPHSVLSAYAWGLPEMEQRLSATIAYSAQLSLRPGVIKETLQGSASGIATLINATTAAADNVVRRVEDGAALFADHILSPIFTAVVTIGVCALAIVVIVYCAYIRFRSSRTRTHSASSDQRAGLRGLFQRLRQHRALKSIPKAIGPQEFQRSLHSAAENELESDPSDGD
jgi:hypothetical protein